MGVTGGVFTAIACGSPGAHINPAVTLHRVVKETEPYRPVKKMEGILLLPGNGNLSETIFMPPPSSSVSPERGSVAVFLASNDIDVWGMDYGWSFVPYGISDFSRLKGWGISKDSEHAAGCESHPARADPSARVQLRREVP